MTHTHLYRRKSAHTLLLSLPFSLLLLFVNVCVVCTPHRITLCPPSPSLFPAPSSPPLPFPFSSFLSILLFISLRAVPSLALSSSFPPPPPPSPFPLPFLPNPVVTLTLAEEVSRSDQWGLYFFSSAFLLSPIHHLVYLSHHPTH